jgi:mycoketide-CoA synthase
LVNAAGTLKDALIRNQAACNIFNISAPKQIGSERLLAYISLELPIKSFVAFSSIAALMHPSGSSIYAAANYAMENIISLSRMKGIESLTIQWGAWSSIGMVSGSTIVAKAMDALNVSLISPYQGICAFVHLMSLGYNKPSLYSCIPFRDNGNFLSIKSINGETSQAAKGAIDFVQHSVSLTVESVAQIIRQCVSNVLDTHIDSLSQSLIQFGADSLCAIEIQMALSKEFNIHLPSTFLFDYPNILAMADMISKNLGITSQDISIDENILGNEILGRMCPTLNIAAIFIRKPDGLSKLGLETPDCTKIVDFERWDPDFAHVIEANIRFGKFLTDIKLFDVQLFNITSREARLMDPQQRLLLEVRVSQFAHAWLVLHDHAVYFRTPSQFLVIFTTKNRPKSLFWWECHSGTIRLLPSGI